MMNIFVSISYVEPGVVHGKGHCRVHVSIAQVNSPVCTIEVRCQYRFVLLLSTNASLIIMYGQGRLVA